MAGEWLIPMVSAIFWHDYTIGTLLKACDACADMGQL